MSYSTICVLVLVWVTVCVCSRGEANTVATRSTIKDWVKSLEPSISINEVETRIISCGTSMSLTVILSFNENLAKNAPRSSVTRYMASGPPPISAFSSRGHIWALGVKWKSAYVIWTCIQSRCWSHKKLTPPILKTKLWRFSYWAALIE